MIEKLNNDQIQENLEKLEGWRREGEAITKNFKSGNGFKGALRFINAVGEEAEAMSHHPDIFNSYNAVRMTLSTHTVGGLTALDFKLAEKIEEAARRENMAGAVSAECGCGTA